MSPIERARGDGEEVVRKCHRRCEELGVRYRG